jgi:hypothetical protein
LIDDAASDEGLHPLTQTIPVRPARAKAVSPLLTAGGVAVFGIVAAIHFHRAGLTLAHYDARAHLVVARRVFDSLVPGWQQVGAVWLPLPHLLDALPVQIDWFYRTGFSGVAISIVSMALAAWSLAALLERTMGDWAGGAVAAALLMLNPNVLYLQSTPMSEPLLFGTTFLAIALVARWAASLEPTAAARSVDRDGSIDPRTATTAAPGWALIAACMTRYEAWPVAALAIALAAVVLIRRGWRLADALRAVRGLALWPLWAIAAFLVNSKITVGAWFVSTGFFVAENEAQGHPFMAWHQVWQGLLQLTGSALPWVACAAAAWTLWSCFRSRARVGLIVPLALAGAALLPWYAYFKGHPIRLRYDVPLIAACAAITGVGISLLPRRARLAAGVAVVALAVWQAPPFDPTAGVVRESQRDARNAIGRRTVTAYLLAHWDHQPIMMSMGSLGHYMHDLSAFGWSIRDFVHEGNGELWKYAVRHPRPFVEWIVVEERAEGGDELYRQGTLDPRFFDGYARVAEGGGVALYQRMSVAPSPALGTPKH